MHVTLHTGTSRYRRCKLRFEEWSLTIKHPTIGDFGIPCGQRPSFSHAAAEIRDDAPLMPESAPRCQHGVDLHFSLVRVVESYR